MKKGEELVLQLYTQILPQLVRSDMPSHLRTAAIKQALQLALEAAEEFAKLVEEDEDDAKVRRKV